MRAHFKTQHLDVDRLLQNWRWLCPESVELVARNVFGDLFLRTVDGRVLWLNVGAGALSEAAKSEQEFSEALKDAEKRQEWFAEQDLKEAVRNGFDCDDLHCLAFKIPMVFAESASAPNNAYVADLYEQVAFLGELHQQLRDVPDGKTIRLKME